jgi:hypothetical protein
MKMKNWIFLMTIGIVVTGLLITTTLAKTNNQGPSNAVGKNKLLCQMTIDELNITVLKHKDGSFIEWDFNTKSNTTSQHVAQPISKFKQKTMDKKVASGTWQILDITPEDPRVTVCGITTGSYIYKI